MSARPLTDDEKRELSPWNSRLLEGAVRSILTTREAALREAIAQEIKAWEASLPDPGVRLGPILRIVRGESA